jgi:hypothetical protein
MKTVRRYSFLCFFAAFTFCAQAAVAQTYSRFLMPIYWEGPVHGAFGSVWEVRTWVHYFGTEPTTIVPRPNICAVLCPGVGGYLDPGKAPEFMYAEFADVAGGLIYIPAEHKSEVAFGSNIRDTSRSDQSAGTEVPIVPEADIQNAPLYLLDVQLGPQMRDALRIYALPETESPEVEIRFFRTPTPNERGTYSDIIEFLGSRRVQLVRDSPREGFVLHPSFAAIHNFDQFPELIGEESVWIEIVPLTSGLRVWAMVSVTNNDTQQITLVTPHRRPSASGD